MSQIWVNQRLRRHNLTCNTKFVSNEKALLTNTMILCDIIKSANGKFLSTKNTMYFAENGRKFFEIFVLHPKINR